MPAVPYAASTWNKLSDLALPTLFGALSGVVSGAKDAAYDVGTKTVQALSLDAHDFEEWFNAAGISFDGGVTWTDSYRGDLQPFGQKEVVFRAWSLTTSSGVYHYQARYQVHHSFFAADGTLFPGGIRLYVSSPFVPSFSPLQTLYTWPHIIADPANTGGNNVITTFPSITPPIKIAGSGPAGKDAFWLMVQFRMDVGGTNNRQTISENDLWRSLDGFTWEKVGAGAGMDSYQSLFKSTTGRLIASSRQGLRYTDSPSLIGATWTAPILFPGLPGGTILSTYGGTLVTTHSGTLISGGRVWLSCNDGGTFFGNTPNGDLIPLNSAGLVLKLGASEVLLITNGFVSPTTETKAYYSDDGGETWLDGGIWLSTNVGERPVNAFLRPDSTPLVITQNRAFYSTDKPRGTFSIRTQCPLANAGLVAARPLNLCGHAITVKPC